MDVHVSGSTWARYHTDIAGIGKQHPRRLPCGVGRLKGHWEYPVWIPTVYTDARHHYYNERHVFDRHLALFAHEFTHVWTVHVAHQRNGAPEPLYGVWCQCHWREDLHAPAAFPWHSEDSGPISVMGGTYWHDNGDGTFNRDHGYWGGGLSWLDLYLMGLADASEVPDTFILRNAERVAGADWRGPYTGERETVSIEQIVAAEGPRKPPATDAPKDFNAGFVYLLQPGQTPDTEWLRLHAEYRDTVIEHWSRITGGRSRMTTIVPGVARTPR